MSTSMLLTALCALALLALLFSLTIYSRRRALALLEETAHGETMGSDRESIAEYYRPMSRILDVREFESLSQLAGIGPSEIARFRASRIAAFREYLNEIQLDFNRVEFKLRYLTLAATEDQAEMVIRLNRLKSGFQMQMIRVEFQFLLFRLGWNRVDVSPLIATLEQLQANLVGNPLSHPVGS